MVPLNHQARLEHHLEDGLIPYGGEKAAFKQQKSPDITAQPLASPDRKFRIMNPRRITLTVGLGLMVGFGLVTASRSRPPHSLCPKEIHASNHEEIKALVAQTKDDTTALTDILRCASPETFHRLVSVYFPEQSNQVKDNSRAEVIGHDETWLLTAWEKLVKRQDEGAGNAATPRDSATDSGAVIVTQTTTVTATGSGSSGSVVSSTEQTSEPASTSSVSQASSTVTETTTSIAPLSSTSSAAPESTTQATSSLSSQSTKQTSSTTSLQSSTSAAPTTSSSQALESSSSTNDNPDRTTIHRSSSAVKATITSVRPDGGMTTITSTSWVAVDPPQATGASESDPSLQDAAVNLRASAGPALLVGGLVTVLLMA